MLVPECCYLLAICTSPQIQGKLGWIKASKGGSDLILRLRRQHSGINIQAPTFKHQHSSEPVLNELQKIVVSFLDTPDFWAIV